MSDSENRGLLARIFDGLPLFVAVGLGVSACAFAAIMAVTSLKGEVTYAIVDKEGAAVVSAAEVGEDSVMTIPGSVGLPWDRHTVRKIENHAFENDERFSRVSLPEGLRVIGYSSFYGCKKLQSLEIPESVEEIDDGAFYGCTALREVRLSPNMATAGEYIFERCASLERVDIPEGVRTLPRSIFCACSSLTEVKLPSSLMSIDPLAFKDCTSLTEIVTKVSHFAKSQRNKAHLRG
ncbi:MAG: leucine-rich repeat domain-containing protein, partial [Marinilabiliaceae bacterium]